MHKDEEFDLSSKKRQRSVQIHFEFKTFKQQIESEILRAINSWKEDLNEEQKKDPNEQPYAVLFKVELYNKIREIYLCNIPIPIDTPELFGMKIGILTKEEWRPFYLVNQSYYEKYKLAGEDLI